MRAILEMAGGLALLVALALGGDAVQRWAGLPVPGPVLGLGAYLLLLASGRCDWSLRAASLLTMLIGAMIVPALVGLALFGDALLPAAAGVAMVLVVSTAVTAVAAAMLFRLAGGRG